MISAPKKEKGNGVSPVCLLNTIYSRTEEKFHMWRKTSLTADTQCTFCTEWRFYTRNMVPF